MSKVNIDENKILGAIVVLENYLDGAIADYEQGDVENTMAIEDCIYVHNLLRIIYNPYNALIKSSYFERYEKVNQIK